MPAQPASGRIPELDGLRGAAIFMVVVWHYFYFYPDPSHHPAGLFPALYVYFERGIAIGWSGVDLFFVLSGFLIGGILLDVRKSPNYFKTFYLRRFFRILPVYYAWVFLYIPLMVVAGTAIHARFLNAAETPWVQVFAHFLFAQNLGFVRYSGVASAWLVSTWSLAVEEQFYLVAPPVIRFVPARVLPALLSLVVIAAPVFRVFIRNVQLGGTLDPAYILMPSRADALAIGILAALLWRKPAWRLWLSRQGRLHYGLFAMFLAGVLALQVFSPDQHSLVMQSVGYTWIALFYGVTLLLVLTRREGFVARVARVGWLRELGRVSYCLYLIHQSVNQFAHFLLPGFGLFNVRVDVVLIPLLAFLISYGIACLSWAYFENPLLRFGHNFKYSTAPAPPAATAALVSE